MIAVAQGSSAIAVFGSNGIHAAVNMAGAAVFNFAALDSVCEFAKLILEVGLVLLSGFVLMHNLSVSKIFLTVI